MNVTEILDSDFKNAFPGILNFTEGILREDLAYVEVMDIGKPIIEARLDVQTGIDALKYCGGVSMALLGGETQSVTELRIRLKTSVIVVFFSGRIF